MLHSFASLTSRPVALFTRIRLLTRMSAPQPPLSRKFVPVEESGITSAGNPDGIIRFRLVSFNILAQVYVKSSLFPHSPSPCLRWKARSQALLTVLKNLEADFLCLQEVDEYDTFYKQNMELSGYSSIYIKRNGQKCDGCGIFYKKDSAELLLEERIEYNDLLESIPNKSTSESKEPKHSESENGLSLKATSKDSRDLNDIHVRFKRDCVGIMAAFQLNNPVHHIVIVANTHLYWDPQLADVKLAQAKYLLSCLSKFKKLVSAKFGCTPSTLLAGDFNSTPGDKVYKYLVSDSYSLVECSDELPILLCSAYGHTKGEPLFTNCTPGFTNTLDYILFCPSNRIKVMSLLELPDTNSPDVEGGLPNYFHPSDHLPIGAEFIILKE